jgi:hypothetical protein
LPLAKPWMTKMGPGCAPERSWKQTSAGLELEVEHPAALEPVFDRYPEFPVASIFCNGKKLL